MLVLVYLSVGEGADLIGSGRLLVIFNTECVYNGIFLRGTLGSAVNHLDYAFIGSLIGQPDDNGINTDFVSAPFILAIGSLLTSGGVTGGLDSVSFPEDSGGVTGGCGSGSVTGETGAGLLFSVSTLVWGGVCSLFSFAGSLPHAANRSMQIMTAARIAVLSQFRLNIVSF